MDAAKAARHRHWRNTHKLKAVQRVSTKGSAIKLDFELAKGQSELPAPDPPSPTLKTTQPAGEGDEAGNGEGIDPNDPNDPNKVATRSRSRSESYHPPDFGDAGANPTPPASPRPHEPGDSGDQPPVSSDINDRKRKAEEDAEQTAKAVKTGEQSDNGAKNPEVDAPLTGADLDPEHQEQLRRQKALEAAQLAKAFMKNAIRPEPQRDDPALDPSQRSHSIRSPSPTRTPPVRSASESALPRSEPVKFAALQHMLQQQQASAAAAAPAPDVEMGAAGVTATLSKSIADKVAQLGQSSANDIKMMDDTWREANNLLGEHWRTVSDRIKVTSQQRLDVQRQIDEELAKAAQFEAQNNRLQEELSEKLGFISDLEQQLHRVRGELKTETDARKAAEAAVKANAKDKRNAERLAEKNHRESQTALQNLMKTTDQLNEVQNQYDSFKQATGELLEGHDILEKEMAQTREALAELKGIREKENLESAAEIEKLNRLIGTQAAQIAELKAQYEAHRSTSPMSPVGASPGSHISPRSSTFTGPGATSTTSLPFSPNPAIPTTSVSFTVAVPTLSTVAHQLQSSFGSFSTPTVNPGLLLHNLESQHLNSPSNPMYSPFTPQAPARELAATQETSFTQEDVTMDNVESLVNVESTNQPPSADQRQEQHDAPSS